MNTKKNERTPIIYIIMVYMVYLELVILAFLPGSENVAIPVIAISWVVRAVFWVLSIASVAKMRNNRESLEKMLAAFKYGLIPFYLVNLAFIIMVALVLTAATWGVGLFTVVPFYIPIAMLLTWLSIIPGGLCGVFLNRILSREKAISVGGEVVLDLMQFVFFLDVLGTAYTLTKANKYKLVNIIIIVLYVFSVIGIVAAIVKYAG